MTYVLFRIILFNHWIVSSYFFLLPISTLTPLFLKTYLYVPYSFKFRMFAPNLKPLLLQIFLLLSYFYFFCWCYNYACYISSLPGNFKYLMGLQKSLDVKVFLKMLYSLLLRLIQEAEITFRGQSQLSLVSFGNDIWLLM